MRAINTTIIWKESKLILNDYEKYYHWLEKRTVYSGTTTLDWISVLCSFFKSCKICANIMVFLSDTGKTWSKLTVLIFTIYYYSFFVFIIIFDPNI